jgi:hypothetical protein
MTLRKILTQETIKKHLAQTLVNHMILQKQQKN